MEPLNMSQIKRLIHKEDNAVWIKDLRGWESDPIRAILCPYYAESLPQTWYYDDYGVTWVAYKNKPSRSEMSLGVRRYA